MYNHATLSSKVSKPRISFLDKSMFNRSNIFQDDDADFTDQPDLVSRFIESKKVSDPESTRIPIVKERLPNGYRIVDLRLDRVKDTLNLIRKHCIETDPLCSSIGLPTDPDSLHKLDYILLRKIADWCSFCAIEEGTGKLVGVIIGSLKPKNDQKRTETRIRPNQRQSLFYLMTLNSCLIGKSQIYERLNVENYFRIYILCVSTKHRGKGIGLALVRTFIDKSRELRASVCVGAFVLGAALTIGRRLGFNYLEDIAFEDALVPGDKDPFRDNSVKKLKLSCLALSVELLPEPPPPSITTPKINNIKNKKNKKR